ncbi:MAG: hypothetical protein EZS28_039090 [Streblomastix strix]|uniref:Uncharacterized protein n=1 Tax=Streblomastix strix TaxID=222440 RepID=A0A5J4U553_9EUKA|nr:MAG: hypothetical protein EZS28_039090 [Streblomastix strix]
MSQNNFNGIQYDTEEQKKINIKKIQQVYDTSILGFKVTAEDLYNHMREYNDYITIDEMVSMFQKSLNEKIKQIELEKKKKEKEEEEIEAEVKMVEMKMKANILKIQEEKKKQGLVGNLWDDDKEEDLKKMKNKLDIDNENKNKSDIDNNNLKEKEQVIEKDKEKKVIFQKPVVRQKREIDKQIDEEEDTTDDEEVKRQLEEYRLDQIKQEKEYKEKQEKQKDDFLKNEKKKCFVQQIPLVPMHLQQPHQHIHL